MHLTLHSDYALRILLYLGVHRGELVPVSAISDAYGISRNHLLKVQQKLTALGYVHAARGRSGGIELAVEPEAINLGTVIRRMEPNFDIVECFNTTTDTCPITPVCGLRPLFARADAAFMAVLDAATLDQFLGARAAKLAEHLAPPKRRTRTA